MHRILFLALLIPGQLSGQAISGIIRDIGNRQPVEFATVYINGTSIGTISSEAGVFELDGIVTPCQVVVSHVSYLPEILTIEDSDTDSLLIFLSPKKIEIEQLEISDKNLREKNVAFFANELLGYNNLGRSAFIQNDSVLRFHVEHHENPLIIKPKNFEAIASAPIKICLELLGYMVHLDLIKFQFTTPLINEETPGRSITNILGKSYYIPIDSISRRKARIYEKNRKAAYYNSRQHFYRSISQDELHENGYTIIGEEGASLDTCIIRKDDYVLINGLKGKKIYVTYYSDPYGNPLTVSIDSINGNNIIRKRDGAAAWEYNTFKSEIQFLNDQCIIRSTGSSPANSILFGGAIGEKRVGATLPSNYLPDSD